MMRAALLTITLALCFLDAFSQITNAPRIPEHYEWKTARDYKRDEDLVIRTLQWLCTTPLNSGIEFRSKATLFVMEWIAGSPRLKISINSGVLPFYDNFPDLLFPYVHGVALKKLGKPACESELEAMLGGFTVVGFMIDSDPILKKEKALQPLLKAYKKNRLQTFVEEQLARTTAP
jgi:hypothetical protein